MEEEYEDEGWMGRHKSGPGEDEVYLDGQRAKYQVANQHFSIAFFLFCF